MVIVNGAKRLNMSEAKSDHDYYYKTQFQVWKETKEFERQNTSMIRPLWNQILWVRAQKN